MPDAPIRTLRIIAVSLVFAACSAGGQSESTQVAAESDGTAETCPDPAADTTLVRDRSVIVEPEMPKPGKGEYYRDPIFGTCILRLTDHRREPPAGFARNDYARRQAFNADNSLALIYAFDGYWHIYNTSTFRHQQRLEGPAGDAEPQWHPEDPDRLYFLPNTGGLAIHEYTVSRGKSRRVARFDGRLPWRKAAHVWTASEGSPSADGRYWAFQVEDAQRRGLGLITYDLVEDSVIATIDFKRSGLSKPDNVSMTPSGRYVVAAFHGKTGTVAFDLNLENRRRVLPEITHGDTAIGPDGQDIYVYAHWADIGWIRMFDFDSGLTTNLTRIYLGNDRTTSLHVSGRSIDRPGWALVSTYADSGPEAWHNRRIYALELAEDPTVISLAHTHVTKSEYWAQPQATVNRDFSLVLFNSNWGSDSDTDVDAYMLTVPPSAFTRP